MKTTTKKVIAREFLIIVGMVLICIISYFITYQYNARIESKRNDLRREKAKINEQILRLEKPVEDKLHKQRWLYERLYQNDDSKYESYQELWTVLQGIAQADSLVYRWHNVWSDQLRNRLIDLGFDHGSQFKEYILGNSLGTENESIQQQTRPLYEGVKKLEDKIEEDGQRLWYYRSEEEMTRDLLILMAILVFPVRFFVLAVRWSIRTLRQKD